jgi:hypothetical protein
LLELLASVFMSKQSNTLIEGFESSTASLWKISNLAARGAQIFHKYNGQLKQFSALEG